MEQAKAEIAFILLAAGSARRMGREKLLIPLKGKTPLAHCAAALARCKTRFLKLVVAVGPATEAEAARLFPEAVLVRGGSTRTESVRNALNALDPARVRAVAIHDAARCLVTPEIIDESIRTALLHGSGIAAIPARDALWRGTEILPREGVWLAQTPQSFDFARIYGAYARCGKAAADDAAVYAAAGYTPCFSKGAFINQKLTYPEDIPIFEALLGGREP